MLEEILRVAPPVAGFTLLADLACDSRPLLPWWPLPHVTANRCQGDCGESSFRSTKILHLRAQNDTLFVALHAV
jgi:hypothetical protein